MMRMNSRLGRPIKRYFYSLRKTKDTDWNMVPLLCLSSGICVCKMVC